MDDKHNPIIGYMLLDCNYRVIGPSGTDIDPIFHTKDKALLAADKYGRRKEVCKIGEQYLEGIFNVVIWDEGDIMLDGQSAMRFIKASKRRGLRPKKRAANAINIFIKDATYSARQLLGDIDYNREILLTHRARS